ncbi:Polyribonucleotide nucleotidyltransferase 1, mitochondrial [Geodia barretti]|uniref:Polyribonucleotide nucleotidyltransferase 1, mitochondrial n=1 Tax=Geodia barretti TaxID=519541 RepID=A0AA35RVB1_GEOBA|nr:Polyribonucleotide nucleotidyltransferase 1, mitochondrial [Geodia barretti]
MSEREILVSRFIDRSIRPFFPKGFSYDTQVICSMLAVDGRHDPEVLAINGATAALCLSDIPWNGPVGAVRVGLIDGKFCLNPTARELSGSSLDLIVTSTERNIVMVEGVGREVAEDTFCEAVLFAHEEVQPLLATLKQLKEERGKAPRTVNLQTPSPELEEFISR